MAFSLAGRKLDERPDELEDDHYDDCGKPGMALYPSAYGSKHVLFGFRGFGGSRFQIGKLRNGYPNFSPGLRLWIIVHAPP